jgi:hypothetical protein
MLVQRAVLGFVAAAMSVLTFHQAMWGLLYLLGMMPVAPYPTAAVPPLGIPQILNLAFWGGLYGVLFGAAMPRLRGRLWLWGIGLGLLATVVGVLVVGPLKGRPVNLSGLSLLRPVLINGFWGLGVGLIAPLLIRRPTTLTRG